MKQAHYHTYLSLSDICFLHQVGDRVVGLKNFGAWSDVVVLPADDCMLLPDNMSLEEAAAIPVNYVTAYLMLFDQGALKPGDKVFVHMAAGNH